MDAPSPIPDSIASARGLPWGSAYPLLGAYLLVCLAVAAVAFGLLRHGHDLTRRHQLQHLEHVVAAKRDEVVQWRADKLRYLTPPPGGAFSRAVADFRAGGWRTGEAGNLALERMEQLLQVGRDIHWVALLDTAGQVRLATGQGLGSPDHPHAQAVRQAVESRQAVWVDFHQESHHGRLVAVQALIQPVLAEPAGEMLGLLLYQIDPEPVLYPLLSTGHYVSPSTESLLFRVEKDGVLYLNPPRLRPAPPMTLRLPLASTGLSPAQAGHAGAGVLEGRDYRGVMVLGAVTRVPDTGWYLLTKTDAAEVYAGYQREAAAVVAGALLFLLAMALVAYLAWRNARSQQQAALAASTLERRRAEDAARETRAVLDAVIEGTDDAVFVKDADGRYQVFNAAAERLTGRRREDVLERDDTALFPADLAARLRADDLDVMATGRRRMIEEVLPLAEGGHHTYLTFKGPLSGPDGRISGLFGIARDIQARKAMEEAITRSEAMFRAYFEHGRLGMAIGTPDRGLIRANPAFLDILGYSEEELARLTWAELTYPADLAEDMEYFGRVLAGEMDGYTLEKRVIRKGGEVIHVRLSTQAVRKPDGQVDFFVASLEDISDRKRMEAERARLTERSEALLRLNERAYGMDEKALLTHGLEEAERLTGSHIAFLHFVNPDQVSLELVTWSASTLHHCQAAHDRHYPIDHAGIWVECVRQRQPVIFNDYPAYPHKHGLPPGHAELTRLISVPVMEGGLIKLILGVGNKPEPYDQSDADIVSLIGNDLWRMVLRRRAEQALRDSEERLALALSGAGEGLWDWDLESGRLYLSASCYTMLGFADREFPATPEAWRERIDPEQAEALVACLVDQVKHQREPLEAEFRIRARDGSWRWLHGRGKVVALDTDGGPLRIVGTLLDITPRKESERRLRESNQHLQELNQKLETAGNQLLQSEKLASIGQLAAGVAHELNNPVGFVHSNLNALERALADIFAIADAYAEAEAAVLASGRDCPQLDRVRALKAERNFDFLREDVGQILDESRDGLSRVRKIVLDLKDFSRVGDTDWQWADLHKGLDSTLNIVHNELKYKCQVHKEYGELPSVHCLPSQLNQVFMNLLVNAGQAIDEKGDIFIRTGSDAGKGEVWVEIRDTGRGIPEENMHHIFEPFFTTKPVGKGTGLGLSVSYGIVQRHGGRIQVESRPGAGSTFRVVLPIDPPSANTP